MSENESVFTFVYKGVDHHAYSIGDSHLPDLKDIISVHALPITEDNKVIVVKVRSRGIDMMGGHVEPSETSVLETLNREVAEEAQLKIKDVCLIDVLEIKSELITECDRRYIILYTAHIDEIGEFTPNDEISERLIINHDEFANTYFGNAPTYINRLYSLALKKF